MQAASRDELRHALRTAAPGSVIDLAPGEYQGVFVINKPITLRGRNRQTVLWRHGAPVLYIRTPGVRLENLLIERTVATHGALIVHDPNCLPSGKESIELDSETLINLGELLPNTTISLPIELTLVARAEINVHGLHGASIEPTVIESPGTHMLTLSVDGRALQKGEVLLGEITLRERELTRSLWITGVVLDSLPPERSLCLATPKVRFFPTTTGIILSHEHFSALDLGTVPHGRYCFIQRDPVGGLSVYMPNESPVPVVLNNTHIPRFVRRRLQEDDKLRIGEVTFTVQSVPKDELLLLEVPPSLNLPDFSETIPEAAHLTIRTLNRAWKGEVISAVDWLSVTPEGQFRLPPNRTHDWTVALNEAALRLPDGMYAVSGGLLIMGNNQVVGVDVRLKVARPLVALQATPLEINAVEYAWPYENTFDIAIINYGRSAWTGVVQSNLPWLKVLNSMRLSGDAWSSSNLRVQVSLDWTSVQRERLHVGKHTFPDALIVSKTGMSSDLAIPLSLDVTPAQGHLQITVPELHFEEVERGAPLPQKRLTVRNLGGEVWQGTVQATQGWLQVAEVNGVAPEGLIGHPELAVPAGGEVEIVIELLGIPDDWPLDTPLLIDELHFAPELNSAPLNSLLPVWLSVVERPPYISARGVSFPPVVRGETPQELTLYLYNAGPAVWRGKLESDLAWLNVPNEVFECPPTTAINIPIGLRQEEVATFEVGFRRFEDAIHISGGRTPLRVPVSVDIRDLPHGVTLETPVINFGQVNPTSAEPSLELIRLTNSGKEEWRGTVRLNAAWLGIENSRHREFALTIPPLSVAEFRVVVLPSAVELPLGVESMPNAITIHGETDDSVLGVHAMIVLLEGAPRLTITPDALVFNTVKPLRLKLINSGKREWLFRLSAVDWLTAAPSELSIEGGQSQTVEVKFLLEKTHEQPIQDDRALVIAGQGREFPVPVEVTAAAIKAAAKALKSDTATLTAEMLPKAAEPVSEAPAAEGRRSESVKPTEPPQPAETPQSQEEVQGEPTRDVKD